jgi:hypothetical protein
LVISRRLFVACFTIPLVFAAIAGAYVVGRGNTTTLKPVAPLVSDEQRVRMDGLLYALLQVKDPAALSDFPSPLFCYHRTKTTKGTACVYGVTYEDESTRRYTIVLSPNNTQWAWLRTAEHAPAIPPA